MPPKRRLRGADRNISLSTHPISCAIPPSHCDTTAEDTTPMVNQLSSYDNAAGPNSRIEEYMHC
eukprot:3350249-Pyramimonas_sp.AAC.1